MRAFKVSDEAKFREGLLTLRWGWGWGKETHNSKGKAFVVDANGKLREGQPWIGDLTDIALDNSSNGGTMEKG